MTTFCFVLTCFERNCRLDTCVAFYCSLLSFKAFWDLIFFLKKFFFRKGNIFFRTLLRTQLVRELLQMQRRKRKTKILLDRAQYRPHSQNTSNEAWGKAQLFLGCISQKLLKCNHIYDTIICQSYPMLSNLPTRAYIRLKLQKNCSPKFTIPLLTGGDPKV